MQTIRLMQPYR